MSNHYEMIQRALANETWAMLPEKFEVMLAFLDAKFSGAQIDFEAEAKRPIKQVKGDVAVIPIHGTISPRASMLSKSSGGTSATAIMEMVREASSDPSIGAIVLDIDSPGGAVAMIPEAADTLYKARTDGKKIVAVANHLSASAALWLMAQANEKVATPSAEIGSLGVMARHVDFSRADDSAGVKTTIIKSAKYKNEANPYEPLGDEARAEIQRRVNEQHDLFVDAVARGYGLSASHVEKNFGQGRVFGAREAKERGMIDRIETMDAVLARLTGAKASADVSRRRMAV